MAEISTVRPQEGYQMKALSCSADILISGAAAGVGKTFGLLLEPLRHVKVPGFGAVAFRRTTTQIRNQGGLWDTSREIYGKVKKARSRETLLEWIFYGSQKIKFSHLEHEKNIHDWQGSQIPLIIFDELTHFTKKMFFYLLSRNRSACGIKPYIRASCNPDPDSWVAEFIAWWIDPVTGFPIPERDGVVRYMVRDGEKYIWGDTEEEAIQNAWHVIGPHVEKTGKPARDFVKSVAFISGSIYDNKKLLDVDPNYLANLIAQDEATVAALFHGSWKQIISDMELYNYVQFKGIFDNVLKLPSSDKYIVADIALEGSNKFVITVWDGWTIIDIRVIPKSNGPEVVEAISDLATLHGVPNHNIIIDADGVGGFVEGYIPGSLAFHGGATPLEVEDPVTGNYVKEDYFNLRTQCYYRSSARVNRGGVQVAECVADSMYDDTMTVRQRIMHERKAIKRDKVDKDGKKRIISKADMKQILGKGESPDILDTFMMRELADMQFNFQPIAL